MTNKQQQTATRNVKQTLTETILCNLKLKTKNF